MRILSEAYDPDELERFVLFDLTPELAMQISVGRKAREMLAQEDMLGNAMADIVLHAPDVPRLFREEYLWDEGVTDPEEGETKDLLTAQQRKEIYQNYFTIVAEDFAPITPEDEDTPWKATDADYLVLCEEGFYFRCRDSGNDIETSTLSYDILSRVI